MLGRESLALLVFALSCFRMVRMAESKLPQEEINILQQIATKMGSKYWEFDDASCEVKSFGLGAESPIGTESTIGCVCNFSDAYCHVAKIAFKGFSLPGIIPPELARLPYLTEIDFSYNYIYGSIPEELASSQLTVLTLLVNRLSGEIPKMLGNITSLTYLCLEANQFVGTIPSEIGSLTNLKTLLLSSNVLTGSLPASFAGLVNLTDFRIDDNNLTGAIPEYIQNWKQLQRFEVHASGLEGPIPAKISLLSAMEELRISDMVTPAQQFPDVTNMTALVKLVLRNCNLSGAIPQDIWTMTYLQVLDVSFNNLVGQIPATITAKTLRFIFLTGNKMTGPVPLSILKAGTSVDLSYNNFEWQSSNQPACQDNLYLNLNLFRSFLGNKNSSRAFPCMDNFQCPHVSRCHFVNCGGKDTEIKENKRTFIYEGDGNIQGGTANLFWNTNSYWGFSSTGDFMDDNNILNKIYTVSLSAPNVSALDATARIAPILLTYFFPCLENGQYTLLLRFAEIQFDSDNTYVSLGRRFFDVYVQDKLVRKDFNIEHEAGGVQKPAIEAFNVTVTENVLEIRLYWAGKGTTRIPLRGVYGPLISAISIASNSKGCPVEGKKGKVHIFVGLGSIFLASLILGFVWLVLHIRGKRRKKNLATNENFEDLSLQTRIFTLKQIKTATNDFDPECKIGEGGFGPVYKGQLSDGTVIAHPNLVKLHGCCIEGDQLMLVYEYMVNNSLSRAMFGPEHERLHLDWPTRLRIIVGIAKGLAFLHEESRLRIVHRDIKATNVLLDEELNPKISDFGLARLDEVEKTHVSTKVAGTIGYMAPEYALWGYLSYKADVYSFGVVVLEIVSGLNNNSFVPSEDHFCILDWAYHLYQSGNLMELVDKIFKSEFDKEEVEMVLKVALMCTHASPAPRPTMSEVVNMLERRMEVPDTIPGPGSLTQDPRFRATRDLQELRQVQSQTGSEPQHSVVGNTLVSSAGSEGIVEINPENRPYLS
ncbi:hypothetical protein MLD38_039946 [Melastoma candidum]|uniref:Uncharacterized protein n=1 Tax=Melastoma candidum TaxID=119954 RepID=A0ACB9L3P9_9MYRT|nr:hypothetical protein MLD38_039946 [Melastoma candidum]